MTASARTRDTARRATEVRRDDSAYAAIARPRSTDGSHGVIAPNNPRTTSVNARRMPRGDRRSAGPTSARTKATFAPDTARRCDSPDALGSSPRPNRGGHACRRGGIPPSGARSVGGSTSVPASATDRASFATRATVDRGLDASTSSSVVEAGDGMPPVESFVVGVEGVEPAPQDGSIAGREHGHAAPSRRRRR